MEKKNNWLYAVLSVFLAIFLWMYVGQVVNPEEQKPLRNLPITVVGMEVLEERGLMITSGLQQTVSVNVKGRQDVLNKLSASTVNATVDVSSIAEAGSYNLTYQVTPNLTGTASMSSLIYTDYYPQNIELTVAKRATRSIPVQGSFTGSVADGYQAGTFSFSPETIEISGEESLVDQIDFARVTLDKTDLSETYSGELPYTFISFDHEPLEAPGLETSTALIRTTLPIVQLKEVALTVNILPGGGATEDDIICKITPATIMISGSAGALEPLKAISLGNVDLSKIVSNSTLTFPIPLTSELTNVSGITEATVQVTVLGLKTATLEVTDISAIHPPDGYTAVPVTKSCQVQIRGSAEAVAAVNPSQLRIVADLKQAVAATGTQTVPVKVYLDAGENVGVVGEYSIVVSISK